MSKTPSIVPMCQVQMSIVAKTKLKSGDYSVSQPQQSSSFSDVQLEISDDSNPKAVNRPNKSSNLKQAEAINKDIVSSGHQINIQSVQTLIEAKIMFVTSQKNRLKILYPTFKQSDILRIAENVWQELPSSRKENFLLRMQAQNIGEHAKHQINNDESASNQSDKDNHSNSQTKNEKGKSELDHGMQLKQPAHDQIRNAERQNVSDQSREQLSRGSQVEHSLGTNHSRSVDGRSNEQTNACSAVLQNSNLVCLPPIYALVEQERSQLHDESIIMVYDKPLIDEKLEKIDNAKAQNPEKQQLQISGQIKNADHKQEKSYQS